MAIPFPRFWSRCAAPRRKDQGEAFAAQCLAVADTLLPMARRLTRGDEDGAQDLVQEAIVRAFEAFGKGKYVARGSLRAYLARILTNVYLSATRHRRWESGVDVETLTGGGETGPVSTWSAPADADLWHATLDEPLERALAALPEGLRLTVVLVDIEGLEYAEAALALDIPVGTVRSRLFRARQLLHDRLMKDRSS